MTNRVVLITQQASLHYSKKHIIIEFEWGKASEKIPLEDLSVLLLEHRQISLTSSVLYYCAEHNVALITCDDRHHPVALSQPLAKQTLHSKIFREQIQAKQPRLKSLWKSIIRSKIANQARMLELAGGNATPLKAMASKVKSGDPENLEARASVIYWKELFGKDFVRNRDLPGVNSLLNYGYSLIRASVAKAIVSAGLHPAFSIFHRNQYNPFCMADDLMEPYRPFVDKVVWKHVLSGKEPELTKNTKHALLSLLISRYSTAGKQQPLFHSLAYYVNQVIEWLRGENVDLKTPVLK